MEYKQAQKILTPQFHGRVFHEYFTSPRTVPRTFPRTMRAITRMEVFHVYFARTVRGENLRGRITSLLLYILVPVPVKYPPMELLLLRYLDQNYGKKCPFCISEALFQFEQNQKNCADMKLWLYNYKAIYIALYIIYYIRISPAIISTDSK